MKHWITGSRWFSSLNLCNGYWQLELAPEARANTALSIGQALDIWAPDEESSVRHSWSIWMTCFCGTLVFLAIRRANLRLHPRKCHLLQPETAFLGHMISAEVVTTDPRAKVETLLVGQFHHLQRFAVSPLEVSEGTSYSYWCHGSCVSVCWDWCMDMWELDISASLRRCTICKNSLTGQIVIQTLNYSCNAVTHAWPKKDPYSVHRHSCRTLGWGRVFGYTAPSEKKVCRPNYCRIGWGHERSYRNSQMLSIGCGWCGVPVWSCSTETTWHFTFQSGTPGPLRARGNRWRCSLCVLGDFLPVSTIEGVSSVSAS